MILKFIILSFIIAIKAVFSASETAFSYLHKAKYSQMCRNEKEKPNSKILKINYFLNNRLKIFSTTKVGINLADLLASVFAADAFIKEFEIELGILGLNYIFNRVVAILIITIILSYFSLVFGELLPRRIARNNPDKVAYKTVKFISLFEKINFFFEKLVIYSENFFAILFGIKNEPSEKLTPKELKLIIAEGKDQGMYNANEKKLLYNALRFSNLKVKDIMLEKEKIIYINIESSKEEILEIIKKYKYTRYPVYSKNKDNINGILNIKDILLKSESGNDLNMEIDKLLRDVMFVNKNENVDVIFKRMQLNNKQIVLVKEEDGKIYGMLTMEDIIEKLVGNIIDEFDDVLKNKKI